MKKLISVMALAGAIAGLAACGGDKKESADAAKDAQKIIQEGMQKEKAMAEGMLKGAEEVQKKLTEQKEETKK